MLTAIETTGTINADHQLVLDEDLPGKGSGRVRVIVLYDEDVDDFSEREWLTAASGNEVFDFLKDDTEDIYTLEDGRPLAR